MNTVRLLIGCLLSVASLQTRAATAAAPYRPVDDSHVVLKLHRGELPAAEREARTLRNELKTHPEDLRQASRLAQLLTELARAEADPRYLGQAESVLAPWWHREDAPPEVLLLRAGIEQSRHQFTEALHTLDRVLTHHPRMAGAWLLKATVLTLRGDFENARRACGALVGHSDLLTALTAAAAVGGVTGEAERSLRLLEMALARDPDASPASLVWCHTVAADVAERLDRPADAERHLVAALTLRPHDPFTLGLWADLLLAQGRPDEVRRRLEPHQDKDALLLRYAEAKAALLGRDSRQIEPEISRISTGFAAARRRGTAHAREEARFNLHLLGKPGEALSRAWENWDQQREPADVRLLLACGRAARDSRAIEAAQAWVRTNRLEDAVFHRLASAP